MQERIDDKVVYYYDLHPTEEDLMGESAPHLALIVYLMSLLRRLFSEQPCTVYGNLNFYQTLDRTSRRSSRMWQASKEFPTIPTLRVGR